MIGLVRSPKLYTSEGERNVYNKLLIFEERINLKDISSFIKIYNTTTNLLENINLNEEILDKFKRINCCIEAIASLKVKNVASDIIDNFKSYTLLHKEALKKCKLKEYNKSNTFKYSTYNIKSLNEEDFDVLYEEISENERLSDNTITNTVYGFIDNHSAYTIISNDLNDKHYGCVYAFIENISNNYNKDLINSIKYILNQMLKIDNKYSSSDYRITMNEFGLHMEHVIAINQLLMAYNYLLNSLSFKENSLYIFDEYEVDRHIELAELIIARVPNIIKYNLDN